MKKIFTLFILAFVFLNFNFVLAEDFSGVDQSILLVEDLVHVEPIEEPIEEEIIYENILIRNGENEIYNGSFQLPNDDTVEIFDANGVSHQVNKRSILGVLYLLDQVNDSFSISNLQYYNSFGAFYLKCINYNGTELCDNWQYVVGGITPYTSLDATLLLGGESIGLYFGTPHKLEISNTTINKGDSISVSSLKYNYLDNTFLPLVGVNIGVTIPNPENPWSPTVISTNLVDENGIANINFSNVGTYNVGIVEDFYFPSYEIIVNDTSGSGGGTSYDFSLSNAISFLSNNKDQFINNDLYRDWVAIGIAKVNGANDLRGEIYDDLKNENFESPIVTDNERHAMALMSMGINPYNGTGINYIEKIISSFDGVSIGDDSIYNDDIFALIVLSHAGYTSEDEIIQKIINFIISKQQSNGSWESVDITSAGIQALENFKDFNNVQNSITQALNYLKNNQSQDGGFVNSFSTSWAVQALYLNDSYNQEVENAINYLVNNQQSDGGLEGNDILSRVWATSYAIPAISKLSWNDILESFTKEEEEVDDPSTKEEIVDTIIDQEVIEDIVVEENEIIPGEDKEVKKFDKEIKKIDNIEKVEERLIPNNLLSASAIGQTQDPNTFFSVIYRIIQQIKYPFLWLWFNLLSLI